MPNTLVHRTEVVQSQAFETADQLIDAVLSFGLDRFAYLGDTYVAELLEETLSDGSKALSIQLRPAERV
jgi:hypothetical protein